MSSNEVDETGAYYTEWSQKEKHQYSILMHIYIYIEREREREKLERW